MSVSPLPSSMVYVNVSVPTKFVAGVYETSPAITDNAPPKLDVAGTVNAPELAALSVP